MGKHSYVTSGTCSRRIDFEITNDGKLTGIRFDGGCNGNLQGICRLCEGQDAAVIADKLSGIRCGFKPTSCPDQLAKAIRRALGK